MVEFLEEVLATHRVLLSIIISTLIAAVIIRVYGKELSFGGLAHGIVFL